VHAILDISSRLEYHKYSAEKQPLVDPDYNNDEPILTEYRTWEITNIYALTVDSDSVTSSNQVPSTSQLNLHKECVYHTYRL
jgi:hypothetical protein